MSESTSPSTPNPAAKPSLFAQLGWAITKLRNFVFNALFILFLVFVIGIMVASCQTVSVPSGSALLINPEGVLVEERSYPEALGDFLQSQPAQVDLSSILRAIELAKEDDDIKAIVLDIDELYGLSPARASRIGAALKDFRESGKKVISYGNFYGQGQFHAASFADALYMHPMGQIVLPGYGYYSLYFNEILSNYDVNIHIYRVGEFKDAIEPFTRNDMSEEARRAQEVLYNDLWQNLLADLAENRAVEIHDLEAYAKQLPEFIKATGGDMARAALENHLVDELLTPDQVRARIADEVGYGQNDAINGIDYGSYLAAKDATDFGAGSDQVGVLVAQGPIVMEGPPGQVAAAETLSQQIRSARNNPNIKALVLRVDSPGGGTFASEVIRQELELFQLSGRPVVASFGSVAASGGYWIAATADEIVAESSSITGSIGIFSYLMTFEDTIKRYGVHADGVGTTSNVIGFDPLLGVSEDMTQILQISIEQGYEQFVNLVAKGRERTPEEIDYIAQGRVWSGAAALEIGLVDQIGGLDDAVARAAELADLEEYDRVRLVPYIDPRQQFLAELMQVWVPDLVPQAITESPLAMRIKSSWQLIQALPEPGKAYAFCLSCPAHLP